MLTRLSTMARRPQRVRTYLVLFAIALATPVVVLAIYGLTRMAALEAAETEGRVLQVAQGLAADVDRELDRAIVTLETLASSAALKRGDFQAFHAQALVALKRTRAAIVLIDRNYRQLMDTLAEYGSDLPPTADPETAKRVIDTGRPQVSNLFQGSITGNHVFNVEVPVFDDKRNVRYVLIMSFRAAHIADLLRSVRLPSPWITGVTDNNGIVLARSERHDDFVGKPLPPELLQQSRSIRSVYRATNIAGEPILRATVRSDIAGWLVSATVPVAYVEAPGRRGQLFSAILLATVLGLGASLASIFGRLMTRPLDAATQAAAAVGRGENISGASTPLDEANVLIGTLSNASSELKRRQEHSEFLMRELAHRAKNQLAVIQGMTLQTALQSDTVEQFASQLSQRIQGLAQSQDLLVRQNWQGAWSRDLVRAHLDLFAAANRAQIDGPDIFLSGNAVQNVGFALHELATNASKYGAFSSPKGRLQVVWRVSKQDRNMTLEWRELFEQGLTAPERHGFGHMVLTQLVPHALQGTSQLEFRPEGVYWRIDIPDVHALSIKTNGQGAP